MVAKYKIGDKVKFKKSDDWSKFFKSRYEVGFVTSGNGIKLQTIKNKERLPYTFNANSLTKR